MVRADFPAPPLAPAAVCATVAAMDQVVFAPGWSRNMGDAYADHTAHALWLGPPLPPDVEYLRKG
jgi:hypothetical protein